MASAVPVYSKESSSSAHANPSTLVSSSSNHAALLGTFHPGHTKSSLALLNESFRSTSGKPSPSLDNTFDDFASETRRAELLAISKFNTHEQGMIEHQKYFPDAKSMGKGKQRCGSQNEPETRQPAEHVREISDDTVDGAAVVALLSDPLSSLHTDIGISEQSNLPSNEWISQAPVQPGNGSPPYQSPLHPLALIPDFTAPQSSPAMDTTWHSAKKTHDDPQDTTSGSHVEAEHNLQSWIDMVNTYHDEVWGDTLPLVQETRWAIQMAPANSQDPRTHDSVRRRLVMIKEHLRCSAVEVAAAGPAAL